MARINPDIAGPEALRPPNAVTDLYAPPPRPPTDTNLHDLATSLSSFNKDLLYYGQGQIKATAKANAEADQAAANKWIAGHSTEDWKSAVASGQLPVYADPTANGVIQKDFGDRLGLDVKNRVGQAIKSGEIDLTDPNTNIDQIVTDQSKAAIEQINARYPNSKFAASGLAQHTSSLRQELYAQQEEARTKANVEARLGVVTNTFDKIITGAGDAGRQPDGSVPPEVGQAANALIRQSYGELSKTLGIGPKGMPPAWMDKQLIGSLKNNAKDHPEVVMEILNAPRKDADGNPLPPLGANPQYANDVQDITKIAATASGAKLDTVVKNRLTTAGVESLNRQDGSYWQIHDQTYTNPITHKTVTIDAASLRKNIMAQYQTWSDNVSQARGEKPDVKFDREFSVYENANVPNPVWKHTLEGVSASLTNTSALTNPAARGQLTQAGELYMQMEAKNYPYLKNTVHLDKGAQSFYDTYSIARRYMGLNADQATDMASHAVNQPGQTDLNVQAEQRKEIESKIDSDFSGGGISNLFGLIGDGAAQNQGQLRKQLGDIAGVLVRVNGVSTKDAVENAEKLLKDRTYVVNGQAVQNNGYLPPPDMKKYVGTALQSFFDQHGTENGVDNVGQLSIKPTGEGKFWITKNVAGWQQPLYVRDGDSAKPAVFTMSDLVGLKKQDQVKQNEEIKVEQSKAADEKILNTNPKYLTPEQVIRHNELLNKWNKSAADTLNKGADIANTAAATESGVLGNVKAPDLFDALGALGKYLTRNPGTAPPGSARGSL